MKNISILALTLGFALSIAAGDEVIRRGEPIGKDARIVPLAEVLEKPEAWTSTAIVVEGVVVTVCENKGCWMEIAPEQNKPGMRVSFLDYGFFVPKDSKGQKARMEGRVEVKKLSKDHADHLEAEGATVRRRPDGSAVETSFVASGVELRKESVTR